MERKQEGNRRMDGDGGLALSGSTCLAVSGAGAGVCLGGAG